MRSPMLPKLSTSIKSDKMDHNTTALPQYSPGHSRNSSAGSSASTPMTPTFSFRGHNRWPSSSSSLATSPDSPVNVGKSSLDDLVEEPTEVDETIEKDDLRSSFEEFCICDTVHCKHQQATTATPPPSSPEWIPGDDRVDLPAPARSLKSQRSLDIGLGKRSSRLSRRWPSISSRWRDRWPTTSLSSPTVQSAPPSRASSAKSYSVKQSLVNHLEPRETILFTGPSNQGENSRPSSPTLPQPIDASTTEQREPIDRQGQASTPLLPPALTELRNNHDENFQSPLQSPSIATPSTTATFADAPLSSPATTYSPSLSAKPSYSSIYRVHSNRVTRLSADIFRPEDIEELDYWTMKLGHANFHISPEPYMPEKCDRESCNRLLADWETARIEYMKQAIMISGEYGVASETYRLTSEKWAEIDRQWQENLNQAKADAEASGERPHQESLAETQTVCRLPSLPFDPANPEKFPSTNEGGIVGPMVQYAKVQRSPSKKNNFLKLFLDPTSLFGGRSPFGSRR